MAGGLSLSQWAAEVTRHPGESDCREEKRLPHGKYLVTDNCVATRSENRVYKQIESEQTIDSLCGRSGGR
jgi:hypothetical protein